MWRRPVEYSLGTVTVPLASCAKDPHPVVLREVHRYSCRCSMLILQVDRSSLSDATSSFFVLRAIRHGNIGPQINSQLFLSMHYNAMLYVHFVTNEADVWIFRCTDLTWMWNLQEEEINFYSRIKITIWTLGNYFYSLRDKQFSSHFLYYKKSYWYNLVQRNILV